MVRPKRERCISHMLGVTYFKPRGVPLSELEEIILEADELEAIRLNDLEGLDQEEAAKKMNISQPTFHRIVVSARKKISEAIIKGKAIRIQSVSRNP
jgi:predicted DNA-binding protein (UPF0251 family)